jgi:hypothetical protein
LGIVFRARVLPQPVTLSTEILEARWFPFDAIPENSTCYAHKAIAAAFGTVDRSHG